MADRGRKMGRKKGFAQLPISELTGGCVGGAPSWGQEAKRAWRIELPTTVGEIEGAGRRSVYPRTGERVGFAGIAI